MRSRQIRPPIYSMKQSKLRRRRVFRYAVLYFLLFIVFMALLIGPSFAGKAIPLDNIKGSLPDMVKLLFQPTGLNNNDTIGTTETGRGAGALYTGKFPKAPTGAAKSTSAS